MSSEMTGTYLANAEVFKLPPGSCAWPHSTSPQRWCSSGSSWWPWLSEASGTLWRSSSPCTGRWDAPWRSRCSLSVCTPRSPLRETIQSLKSNAIDHRARVAHVRLKAQSAIMDWQELRLQIVSNLLRKSYCLIWESWGKIQLHTEGKTTEEETLQLISPSPLLLPITGTKESGSKPVSSKQEEVKKRNHLVEWGVSLHFPSAGHLFFVVCFLRSSASLQGPFIPASR